MSTETPATPPAAPTAPPASPATTAPPAANPALPPVTPPATPTADPKPGDPPAFKVPDAYKDKPWASKIKSEDDVYKQIDTLDAMKGKKFLQPDPKTSTPQELEEYYNGLRPAEVSAYKFGDEFDQTQIPSVGKMLHEAGISEHQANKLLPAYTAFEKARMEEATSADGFKAVMEKSFGEKFDPVVASVSKELQTHLSADDQKLVDTIPNEYLGVIYRLTVAKQKEIETLKKEYGVKENGDAHLHNNNSPINPPDFQKQASEKRAEIRKLETGPHTADQKQKLVDELDAIYKNKK